MTPLFIYIYVLLTLGLVLAIPSNTCIVMVNLEIVRNKGKLSPSDVIFMVKGMVNILRQCLMSLQGMTYVLSFTTIYNKLGGLVIIVSAYFLQFFSFWMTVWLSAHYCTNITNLSSGFFIWIKRIVSNYLNHVLILTALGLSPLSVLTIWVFNEDSQLQYAENITEASITAHFNVNYPYFVPVTFLGVILPFCLSVLCLLLTFSFLVRHVWRVKNNDSGSSRPNLQAHVTALRTIFFLLFMFIAFFMSSALLFFRNSQKNTDKIDTVRWTLLLLSSSAEAAIIFQASNKLRRIIVRRFWTRSWSNMET